MSGVLTLDQERRSEQLHALEGADRHLWAHSRLFPMAMPDSMTLEG